MVNNHWLMEHEFYFPYSMGCHPSHWLSHIFKDGYCTTSQILLFIFISLHHIISPLWLVRNCKIAINCSLWITAFSNIPQSSYINTPIDSIVLSHHSSEQTKAKNHLVGALEHFFPYIGVMSSSQLLLTPWFFRGVGGSTTNQSWFNHDENSLCFLLEITQVIFNKAPVSWSSSISLP